MKLAIINMGSVNSGETPDECEIVFDCSFSAFFGLGCKHKADLNLFGPRRT